MGSQTIRAAMECHRACNNKKLQDEISLADRFSRTKKRSLQGTNQNASCGIPFLRE